MSTSSGMEPGLPVPKPSSRTLCLELEAPPGGLSTKAMAVLESSPTKPPFLTQLILKEKS